MVEFLLLSAALGEFKVPNKVLKCRSKNYFSSSLPINWGLMEKIFVELRLSQASGGVWTQLTDRAGMACGGFPDQRRGRVVNSEALYDVTDCARPGERKVRQELAARWLTCRCRGFDKDALRKAGNARAFDSFGVTRDADGEVTDESACVTTLDVADAGSEKRQQTLTESFSPLKFDGFDLEHILGHGKNNTSRMLAASKRRLSGVAARSRRTCVALCCTSGLLFSLPGCTFIAKDGPEGSAISSGAVLSVPPPSARLPYALVSMSPSAIDVADRF